MDLRSDQLGLMALLAWQAEGSHFASIADRVTSIADSKLAKGRGYLGMLKSRLMILSMNPVREWALKRSDHL